MATAVLPRLKDASGSMPEIDRLGWTAGISFVCHGARIGIRVNDPAVLDRLAPYLPPGWQPSTSPVVDHLYSLLVGRTKRGSRVRRRHRLYGGDTRLLETTELDEVLEVLESDLHFQVALNARRRLFVHAGVVGWRGQAIVIAGRSMSGKTTLVEALVRAGATYYSDEYAAFDARGRVHPYPKPLNLRQENGARPKKCPVEELGVVAGTEPLPVGLIVIAKYEAAARWRPRVLSPGEALLALLDNTVLARIKPELALATLQRVVPGAVALKGKRGEAKEIIESLLSYLGTEPALLSEEAEPASRRNGSAHSTTRSRPRAGRREKVP